MSITPGIVGATPKNISLAWAWAQGVCISILGPLKGEQFARTLDTSAVLRVYVRIKVGEA